MKRLTLSFLAMLAGLMFADVGSIAAPVNKCVVNGAVSYQQSPCPSGQVRKAPTVEDLNAGEKNRRAAPKLASIFKCDGRQYCSQMSSCAEAKFFVANCPGVKMDGDKNGLPCEKQWCAR